MNDGFFVLSAFILGALHALEPGHGKTVVAAYLVGSRGTVRDAITLGGVVTFTHTFSIIVLGLITALAATYLVPETVHEVLEVVSGLLVVGVGLWMVRERILLKRSGHGHSHDAHPTHHTHDHPLVAAGAGEEHSHDHTHPHPHPHEHSHVHPHEEPHQHGGHSHSHALAPGQRATLGGLITLGISGGIVPCPAALALLLAAVAVGNVVGGVSLVIVFSLGLAAVLIAIGIVLVKAAKLAERYLGRGAEGESPLARRAGAASAILVTLLGLAMTVRAFLDVAGVRLVF